MCVIHQSVDLFTSNLPSSRAHHEVLTKHLGVKKVYCAIGFSMGGQQVRYLNSSREKGNNSYIYHEGVLLAVDVPKFG